MDVTLKPSTVPLVYRDLAKNVHRLLTGGYGAWCLTYGAGEASFTCDHVKDLVKSGSVYLSDTVIDFVNGGRSITVDDMGLLVQRAPVGVVASNVLVRNGVWHTPPILVQVPGYPDPTLKELAALPDGDFQLTLKWGLVLLRKRVIVRPK
jgi:hypothetical protein